MLHNCIHPKFGDGQIHYINDSGNRFWVTFSPDSKVIAGWIPIAEIFIPAPSKGK